MAPLDRYSHDKACGRERSQPENIPANRPTRLFTPKVMKSNSRPRTKIVRVGWAAFGDTNCDRNAKWKIAISGFEIFENAPSENIRATDELSSITAAPGPPGPVPTVEW
jgi:hypothetical protein